MARKSHLHDIFTCPHIDSSWHKTISKLKDEARDTASEKLKKLYAEEIYEILVANVK